MATERTTPQTSEMTSAERRTGTIQLVIAMVLSGTIGLFFLKSGAAPVTAAWARCVIGALAMGLVCALCGYFRTSGYTPRLAGIAVLGGLALVVNWALLFAAYSNTSIGIATVTYHLQPFMLILAAPLVLKESITRRQGAWVTLGFVGLVLIAQPWHSAPSSNYFLGLLQALAAAAFYAAATLIAKKLPGVRPHVTVFVQMIVGVVILAPLLEWSRLGDELTGGWSWLVGLGLIHTCVMYVLMYSAFPRLEAVTIAVLGFVYPVVALVVDVTVFGTRLGVAEIAGVAAILAAGVGNARRA